MLLFEEESSFWVRIDVVMSNANRIQPKAEQSSRLIAIASMVSFMFSCRLIGRGVYNYIPVLTLGSMNYSLLSCPFSSEAQVV